MTNKLSLNILRLLRHRSKSTPLRRLEQRGLKNVTVLNIKDLKDLIRDAVNNTLRDFGISLSPDELKLINDRAREELLRVMGDRDDLKASMKNMEMELETLKGNFMLLKAELEVNSRMLESEETRVIDQDCAPLTHEGIETIESSLADSLRDLFAEHGGNEELRDQAILMAHHLIDREREKALDQAKASQEDRIAQLKRRIGKLNSKLRETEDLLTRVRAEARAEHGIPSEFRGLQGLSEHAAYYEEKEALLREIFTLNMDLKRLMTEA